MYRFSLFTEIKQLAQVLVVLRKFDKSEVFKNLIRIIKKCSNPMIWKGHDLHRVLCRRSLMMMKHFVESE